MRRTLICATAVIVGGLSGLLAATSPGTPAPPAPLRARHLPEVLALQDGRSIERRLERGDDHRYRIALSAGDYVLVIVEQRGIDVVAETRDSAGDAIADFEDEIRSDGEERVELVAETRGIYAIAIKAPLDNIEAGSYAIRIAAHRAATDTDRAREQARRLRTTADRLDTEGRFDAARLSLERALTITETAWGPDDLHTAAVAAQLAGVHRRLADGGQSESLYQRAIAIMDRTLGSDHPSSAVVRSQLAVLYQHQGERRK